MIFCNVAKKVNLRGGSRCCGEMSLALWPRRSLILIRHSDSSRQAPHSERQWRAGRHHREDWPEEEQRLSSGLQGLPQTAAVRSCYWYEGGRQIQAGPPHAGWGGRGRPGRIWLLTLVSNVTALVSQIIINMLIQEGHMSCFWACFFKIYLHL